MNYKGSGRFCAVFGCNNSSKKRALWLNSECEEHKIIHEDCPCLVPFSMHLFPKDDVLEQQWISAINRKCYKPGKSAVVCSVHFLDGRPTATNPIPQLLLGYDKKVCVGRRAPKRRQTFNSSSKVSKRKQLSECGTSSTSEDLRTDNASEDQTAQQHLIFNTHNSVFVQTDRPVFVDQGVQWEDPSLSDHSYASHTQTHTKTQITQTDIKCFSYLDLNDSDCKFFTGITLMFFLELVKIFAACVTFPFTLPIGDQLLIVLMRLRLGLVYADLARRFEISTSLVGKIFTSWLPVLSKELRFLVAWLPRETLRANLPNSFKECYPKTTCIIDCTEMFISRPSLLNSRALTYSSYKHHNTVKILVGIAPCGYFMYLSKCFGGRASDKYLVTSTDFMDYLLPGDEVMADRGFDIPIELASRQVKLNVPSFTKGKTQLTEQEVTKTRRIASVRIHVERAIGRLKNYRILKNTLPGKILKRQIDDIVIICASLCNMQSPILKR